uniref:Uncharacterized protein n=1 Tax=Solanum lycopersicum TaxID=4081 RepID=A0A3Q7EBB4_SOLLC
MKEQLDCTRIKTKPAQNSDNRGSVESLDRSIIHECYVALSPSEQGQPDIAGRIEKQTDLLYKCTGEEDVNTEKRNTSSFWCILTEKASFGDIVAALVNSPSHEARPDIGGVAQARCRCFWTRFVFC